MKVKTRYEHRYSPSNTHGFHTVKRDRHDSGKDENHSKGLSCLEVPNVGTFPAHSRPNIAHLATIFVSFSDSSETHLSIGGIRRTFASKGKRRAGWDGLGEVKGPRDTAFAPPAAAASPRVGRANGTVGDEQKGRHIDHPRSHLGWPGNTASEGALYPRHTGHL